MARSRRSAPGPRSVLLPSARSRGRSRRGASFAPPRRARPWRLLLLSVILIGGLVAGAVVLLSPASDHRVAQRDAVTRYATAWARGDSAAMWRTLTPSAQETFPEAGFAALRERAEKAAGVRAVVVGRASSVVRGVVSLPVVVRTASFGALRGAIALPVATEGDVSGVRWTPHLRLPGLRSNESVVARRGRAPARGRVLAADGTALGADALGASIAGTAGAKPTGLQRLYGERLGGHPSLRLLFGTREIRRVPAKAGRTLRTTIRPGLQRAAAAALGDKLGGIAVVRPQDGAVLALAGLAVSAPQPPGSTFKIITVSAALQHKLATPRTSFPVRSFAVLSGTRLSNAGGESCGGPLAKAFADSCNSVFAPLGAKLGAKRLLAAARGFGFGEDTAKIPALKLSTIGPELRDDLAVGAAAIGQDTDLATPLQMATVGATIAADGVRARPHLATIDPVVRHKVVSRKVAEQVRQMMIEVVSGGTGTAAQLPGIQVAGKTGTAELRPGSDDPKDADAWFVAFAPAKNPKVAVAVMLVGAGFGGTAAAPVAKQVLAAALR